MATRIPAEVRKYFQKLPKKGAAKGGLALAAKMTPSERSEATRKAARARWAKAKKGGG